jgi:hypothetical protein
MDRTRAKGYRCAAARCRKAASSSINPKEWIALAEQWESLADTALQLLPPEGRNKDEPSSGRTNGSAAPGFHDDPFDWVP